MQHRFFSWSKLAGFLTCFTGSLCFAAACGGDRVLEAPADDASRRRAAAEDPPDAIPEGADVRRGGRLYDNWMAEKKVGDAFKPDSSKTPELDGRGGPNENGTLNDGKGAPLANPGHDYRLKNLFGWDLRGASGVYGPDYQNKSFVLDVNLLEYVRSAKQLAAWLRQGDERVPAYGAVLDEDDLRDLSAFLVAMRSRKLPHPTDVWELSKAAPKNYALLAGGNPARGAKAFSERCADCHGKDGTKIAIDETESVGTMGRTSGYEIWLKILDGQPGTKMHEQVTAKDGNAAAQGKLMLDILAALCDRSAYPKLETGQDVPDGDPRCGTYLK